MRNLFKLTAFKLALLIGLVFAAVHFYWRAAQPRGFPFNALNLLEAKALDLKFKQRGPVPSSGSVVVAGVDEASLQRYGLWPWKRELVGKAVANLEKAGALAVGMDMWFTDPDRSSPHLAVNQMVDRVVAELPGETGIKAAPALAGLPAKFSIRVAEPLARAERVDEAIAHAKLAALQLKMADPDELFAESLHNSPRVVMGAAGMDQETAAHSSPEVRERDAKAVERFALRELFDPAARTADADGNAIRDWMPAATASVASLRRGETINGVEAPLPVLAKAIHHLGLVDARQDEDGTIRRYWLVRRLGDQLLPSLGLASVAVALDASPAPFLPEVVPDGLNAIGLMRGDQKSGLRLEIPVDPFSGAFIINYPGPAHGSVDGKPLYGRLSLADAVDNTFDPAVVKDKIVLVGATAAGTFDQRVTPFDSMVAGVYTHAAVIDNILTKNFLTSNVSLAFAEIALLVVLALLFGLLVSRFQLYWQLLSMVAVAAAYLIADMVVFKKGLVLSTVMPLSEIAVLNFAMIFFNYVTADREKRQVRTAFQYYLTKSVMEEMLKHPEKLKLGGDKRELSVLFSDIRGFTTISERLPPEELVRTLNEYLTPMTDLVFKHEGTLDKYMGDAIMAIWGAPLTQEDHALRACAAAVEMLQQLAELSKRWAAQGRPIIDIGIGINSGHMAVGNMGSDMRFDYTVMGDNVNLGSRLEGTNKEYGTHIIISEFTFALVKGKVVARELGSVRVKGKKKPVGIYELRGMGAAQGQEAQGIAQFEQGLVAYRARDWDGAERCFKSVEALWPGDGPSGHYLEDIAEKRAHPPAEGWDGVYEMKHK